MPTIQTYKPTFIPITNSDRPTTKGTTSSGKKKVVTKSKSTSYSPPSFKRNSLDDRGIATYDPITGKTTWQIASKPNPTKPSTSTEPTSFYPGRSVVQGESSNKKIATNNTPSKSTPSNYNPAWMLAAIGTTGGLLYGASKYLNKKYPGSVSKDNATFKVNNTPSAPKPTTVNTKITEPTNATKNNNSTYIKTKAIPKIDKVNAYDQALADMKAGKPTTGGSYKPTTYSAVNKGPIGKGGTTWEKAIERMNAPTVKKPISNSAQIKEDALALRNAIKGREVYNNIKAQQSNVPNVGDNLWDIIAKEKSATSKASAEIKHQMKTDAQRNAPKKIETKTKSSSVRPSTAMKNDLTPRPAINKNYNTPRVSNKIGNPSAGYSRVGRSVGRLNALAVPFQLAGELGVMKETYTNLVKQYGKEGADAYIKTAQKRTKESNTSRQSSTTNAGLAKFEQFYSNGGQLNKGWGDVLGSVAVGAGTGALSGSVVPGWGTAVGAIVGGVGGLIKGLGNNKQERLQEQAINDQNALQLAQQKRLDAQYMANYRPNQMNSLFAFGGNIGNPSNRNNPTPNNYIVIRNKARKYVGGEPTNNFIDKLDTLVLQDNGVWAENLQGTNIPKSLPTDSNGRIIFPKNKRVLNTLANKANGGTLDNVAIPNKNSVAINPNAEVVLNNQGTTAGSHETGQNIPVINEQGSKTANVEPGEVVMTDTKNNQFALSARLGFAQKYQMLNDMVTKAGNRLNVEKDPTKRNTIVRNIDKIKRAMDMLPQQQEIAKVKLGKSNGVNKGWGDGLTRNVNLSFPTPNPTSIGETGYLGNSKLSEFANNVGGGITNSNIGTGIGSNIGTIAQIALPFITNAMNNRTLNKSMKQINSLKNTPISYRNLDDKVDTSAQIGEVNRSYRDAVGGTRNLSDSRTAAMAKGEFAANRVSTINSIIEGATNTSRGIRNNNISNINQFGIMQAQKNDELAKYKLENSIGLDNAKIAGRNQTVDNIYQMIKEKNMSKNDLSTMDLIISALNNNEVIDRNLATWYEKQFNKPYPGKVK